MVVHLNERNRAFQGVPAALQNRTAEELFERLAAQGIQLVHAQGDDLVFQLAPQARPNVYPMLEELKAAAVSLEPADIVPLTAADGIAFGIARGLQASVPTLCRLLIGITPEELFNNLDQAAAFVVTDHHPDERVQQRLNVGATQDLHNAGLLEGDLFQHVGYRDKLDRVVDDTPPELPAEYRADQPQWRNPFSENGGW